VATTTEQGRRLRVRPAAALACAALCASLATATVAGPAAVQLEALTSPELRERIAAGATTVLLPIGGTEQNGPHMTLGKHNARVAVLAARIAERLGHTLVAPVLAYVPEGAVEPPQGHMRFAGTVSVPEPAFEAVLEGAARSLCRHGLRDVVLLGDHGGYQRNLARVAARFPESGPCRVHALPEYYEAAQAGYAARLRAQGFAAAEIGVHAGLADTALTLATAPGLVRTERLGRPLTGAETAGVQGDPHQASVALGQLGVELIVDTGVTVIRRRLAALPRTR
jgi:creatinine amidohydrolase